MIAGIILAAGTSSRLGRPKQLLPYKSKPLTQHVIDAAIDAGLDEVIVVLGHAADEISAALELRPPGRVVMNPDFASGQSSSLRAGLRAASPEVEAAVVLLADQPGVKSDLIRQVVEAYRRTRGPVIRVMYGDVPGHPVLFDRGVWDEVKLLEGDVGARDLLVQHPEWIVTLAVDAEPPSDIDTLDDYEGLSSREQ